VAKKKAAAKPSKSAVVKSAGTGDDPNQTYIDGLEQPKASELDDAIMSYEAAICERKRIREEVEDRASKLIVAFEEADVQQYRWGGRVYFLEDGGIVVKRRKAKE
jgi:hypothetical protein